MSERIKEFSIGDFVTLGFTDSVLEIVAASSTKYLVSDVRTGKTSMVCPTEIGSMASSFKLFRAKLSELLSS